MNQIEALATMGKLAKEKKVFAHSLAYKTAIEAIKHPDAPISCGKNTGSGRFSSSTSWQAETARILMLAGVAFSKGNSAPKGGKHGDNIAVHF
jgi:hypothetical protein